MTADHFVANLDVERAWAGAPLLALAVRRRLTGLATIARVLAPDHVHDVTVWLSPNPTELVVEPSRVPPIDGLPMMLVPAKSLPSDPPRWGAFDSQSRDGASDNWRDAAWTARTPAAVASKLSDRRFAHALATELGVATDGIAVVTSRSELLTHAATLAGPWVAKAVLTAAGRDRVFGDGPSVPDDIARRLDRLFETFGAMVVEPWRTRFADIGVCGVVGSAHHVVMLPPHTCVNGPRGQFSGIELAPPKLAPAELAYIVSVAAEVGARVASQGLRGPFSVDAFTYQGSGGETRVRPLVEINPRYSFGHVAHALRERCGAASLGLGGVMPPGARPLLLASPADATLAWFD